MSEIGHNGGPAFPVAAGQAQYPGMDLRDWFAGQALVGLLARQTADVCTTPAPREAALYAYAIADAMLAERGKRHDAR